MNWRGFDSLLLALPFGYCVFLIGRRLIDGEAQDNWGVIILLLIGGMCCLAMTLFALYGFWRGLMYKPTYHSEAVFPAEEGTNTHDIGS